jgi:hypothetical protein
MLALDGFMEKGEGMGYRLTASAIICFLAILLLGADGSLATEASDGSSHNWAISFAVGGDFTLDPLEGSGVSISRRLTDRYSLRLSEGLHVSRLEYTNASASNALHFTDQLSLVCLGYINPSNRARFYWGAGPLLYYDFHREDAADERKGSKSAKSWSVGLIALLGIEVFATDYLSFQGEYRSSGGYARTIYSTTGLVTESYYADIGEEVTLGMSVHF